MIPSQFTLFLLFIVCLWWFEKKEVRSDPEFQIRFGIIEKDSAGYYDVSRETTRIPFIYQSSGFHWGYSVTPPDERLYTTSEVISMPSPPKLIDFPLPISTQDGGRIIITPNIPRQDQMVHFYGFSEGDPLGWWKLQIIINGRVVRTVRFEVYPA